MRIRLMRLSFLSLGLLVAYGLLGVSTASARKPWKERGRKSKRIYIESTPENAAVYVNDKKWGIFCYTPCKRVRLPYKKTFTLIFVKSGYKDKTETLYTRYRYKRTYVRTVLSRQIQPSILDIQSDASGNATGAMILVNGVQKGTVPMKVKVKPGRHQVRIMKAGYTAHEQWVTVTEKQVWTIQAIMKPTAKPKGTLLITVDVSGATVSVDGKVRGSAPVVVKLLAGPHTVEVSKAGAPTWKQVVVVQSGKVRKVIVNLSKSIPKKGTLRVVANVPGAEVYVDGEKKGVAPMTVKGLIPGDHIVLVKAKGYLDKQVPFKIIANQQSLVPVTLEKAPVEKAEGTLRIQSDQPDAEVILDGQRIGKAPIEKTSIRTGLHIIKVIKKGFITFSKKVKIRKGQVVTITAYLKAGGMVKITSSPAGATVFIDSKAVGKTPLFDHVLTQGTYTVEVALNKYHSEKRTLSVRGGKPVSMHVELRYIRTGPTPDQLKRGLSSFGANTVPGGSFTADVGTGYPYLASVRLTVGAWKGKYFGLDAGIAVRAQGIINEFAAHARFQLYRIGPFAVGIFTEIGGGPGYESRNTFFWDIGAVMSLSFKNIVTASVKLYGKIYSDQFCRSEPANSSQGEKEPAWCARLDDDTYPNGEWDEVPSRFVERMREPDGYRKRFTGARFMMSLSLEVAVAKHLSIYAELRGAPGMRQRALWHDYFNSMMPLTREGGDPRIYGAAGLTFKF